MRSVTVGRVVHMGNPRYVNGMEPITKPKTCDNLAVAGASVLTVIRVDFRKLICSPTDAT